MKPQLYIIAGPNGAGKTTFATTFLPRCTRSKEFVNADDIARRLSPTDPQAAAIHAGREMLERIRQLSDQRIDFSIETTLSGRSYLPWLQKLRAGGYEIHLFFLWLPEVELCIKRVADRVRKGGHHIPEEVIRRRYQAGIVNLFELYRPVLNSWKLFDNSHPILYPVATELNGSLTVLDESLLAQFMKISQSTSNQQMEERPGMPDWAKAVIAMRLALAEVVEEHARTGHPLITWRDGKVYLQPPEEARCELEAAARNDPWASSALLAGG